ncbi:MAG: molecular chaperone, partial [Thiotrichales bacterium]
MKYDNSESKNQVATIQHLHTGPSTRLKQLLLGYCLVLAAALLVGQAQAAAQLMISPTRVVFEGTERSKQVNLINNGSDVGRFRISFVRRKMLESGQIEAAEEGEPGMYSDDMVRFAPRQVTLQPGQSQTVRLMLRKKSGLEDGEYRSHLMFQSLPDSSSSNIEELASDNAKGVSVQLIPVVGITIPVIVRQ